MRVPMEFDIDSGYALMPVESGLIHKTYSVSYDGRATYILQRINTNVFPDVGILERNIRVVADCVQRAVLARGGDVTREALRHIPSRNGSLIVRAEEDSHWRLAHYVPESTTADLVGGPTEAASVAQVFGGFQLDLWGLRPDRIQEAIPGFHDTPRRYRRLQDIVQTLDSSPANERFAAASDVMAEVHARVDLLGIIEMERVAGRISTHICHNDAKVSNVLLDARTRGPLCVIDMDTVGPGSPLMDVGDLLRTAAATATEEERDLSNVAVDPDIANAIVDRFSEVLFGKLNGREQQLVAFAGWLITMEQAIRYLTDYLENDVYYGERYPGHNLCRAQNQLRLALSMEGSIVDLSAVI